ncbi:hypothetical protein [Accumulibacter sp.]|nr:hypothetical protein [Accumulibacter sp.]MDS4054754.1 hypothetical protein [Accumulibacter sp.]HMW81604.1 hypothetical protein [Accumulibacter sp.]HNB68711.1 hypothetical protein [Accumulibacter sp.]
MVDVRVDALVRRTRKRTDARFLPWINADAWWVVLATLHIAPAQR